MDHKPLTYGSVCTGIGAAERAFGLLGWRCAFMSEIAAFPRAVLTHHHPEVPLHGDFTTIQAGDYEPIDLLVGGTPCQGLSVAGRRGGLRDDRSSLALEYSRLADRLRPRWVLWENVPGAFTTKDDDDPEAVSGEDFAAFLSTLVRWSVQVPEGGWKTAGILAPGPVDGAYGVAWRVLDAQFTRTREFPRAVPQRRRRIFVVGHLGDWRPPAAVLLEPESLSGHPPPRRETGQGAAGTLAARAQGGGGLGTDFDLDGGLDEAAAVAHTLKAEGFDASEDGTGRGTPLGPAAMAFGGNDTRGPIAVETAINAHGGPHGRVDFESETFIAQAPPALTGEYGERGGQDFDKAGALVAYQATGDSFWREGRGPLSVSDDNGSNQLIAHAFDARQSDVVQYGAATGPLDTDGHSDAVAFALRGRDQGALPEVEGDGSKVSALRAASGGSTRDYVAFQTRGSNVGVEADLAGTIGSNADRASGSAPMIAFTQNSRSEVRLIGSDGGIVGALGADIGVQQQPYVAFTAKDGGADAGDIAPTQRGGGHDASHANGGVMPAVAFTASEQANGFAWESEAYPTLSAQAPSDTSNVQIGVRPHAGVRRLTPLECSRLQAFPDDFANIPWRGRNGAPDGPMYKAYGNSMACNVMHYLGERIAMVERLVGP